jgi:hypothetical protein
LLHWLLTCDDRGECIVRLALQHRFVLWREKVAAGENSPTDATIDSERRFAASEGELMNDQRIALPG